MQFPQTTYSTTHSDLVQQVIEDIIALDRSNMAPLLQRHGQQFNEAFVRRDISRHHGSLQNVVCCYDQQKLMGYFRYNIDVDGHLLVRSFQLNPTAPKRTLIRLLSRVHILLQAETALMPGDTLVYAISNSFNTPSIRFQQKLGFYYDREDGWHCQLQTTASALLKRLYQLTNRPNLTLSIPG